MGLENFEKGVVKGATEAAKVATNVVKKDQENYQKQQHHPKGWQKWLPGNNGLYDENPSAEQDAMKEVEPSGEPGAMNEVSGTGLIPGAAAKGAAKGVKKAAKEAAKGLKHLLKEFDETPSGEQDAMSEVVGNGK